MSADENGLCNPALSLRNNAKLYPSKLAIWSPKGALTYAALEEKSDAYAFIMRRAGIEQGHKVVLMIKPSINLYIMAFALMKIGAIPVVVDPGMGLKRMLRSYRSVSPEAFVGIMPAHIIRFFASKSFETIKIKLWVNEKGISFASDPGVGTKPVEGLSIAATRRDDLGIINFTTGSTGPAKAVEATYGMVMATVDLVVKHTHQSPSDIDLVTVPFFGIVSLIIGSSIVIPPMNPAKPAEVDPTKIIESIQSHKVTVMLASPALLKRVGTYAKAAGIKLPTLKFVNSGGAPIDMENLANFISLLEPQARMNSSWGATEGLPLASIDGRDILGRFSPDIASGKGSPLGPILSNIELRIIRSTEGAIASWKEVQAVNLGEIGEIIVSGPNVSRSYHNDAKSNAAHKILEEGPGVSRIWHRTGDLAWEDSERLLFFTGRKAHSFKNANGEILHSVAAEGVTNAHPKVMRSALVGAGQRPVMCIELKAGVASSEQGLIAKELIDLMQRQRATESVKTILFHRRFPVDLRHNAKIERPILAIWASHELLRLLSPRSKFTSFAKLIPIAGWCYLALGCILDLPPGFWTSIWWIDLFLSTVVHLAQIPQGVRVGAIHGYNAKESALRTFIFGATWWKPMRLKEMT